MRKNPQYLVKWKRLQNNDVCMVCACMCVCSCATFVCSWGFFFLVFFCVFQNCALNTVVWVGALSGRVCCKDSESTNRGIKQDFLLSVYFEEDERPRVLERNTRNMLFCKCKGGVYWWWGLQTHQRRLDSIKEAVGNNFGFLNTGVNGWKWCWRRIISVIARWTGL